MSPDQYDATDAATPTRTSSGAQEVTGSATADGVDAATAGAALDRGDDGSPDRLRDELPLAGRKALVTLLTHRFVSRSRQGEAWAALVAYEPEIRARLDEMFLVLIVDHEYEVAFKRQSGQDDVPILLRREKPMSRDASLLLVFLRREHAFSDAHDESVVVSRHQIAEFLDRYHDDASHDEIRSTRRVDAAIAAMVTRDLLEPEPDDPALFVVAPAIVPLVTAEQLAHLERVFLEAAGADAPVDAPLGVEDDEPSDDEDSDDGRPDDGPRLVADPAVGDSGADEAPDAAEAPDADEAPRPDPTAVALDIPLDPEADQA
ncbi:hypothetical protein ASF17_08875 [Frigoribacterium sp. Leaf263]|uniref:DUF4194 domain-containing protein n=1 Tax=Frigoribacterium sp. Leaf263 TaxID=1736313 RepID=UPI0007001174|nr:DUF4194 domain-containing protein [Frigoribacterium sp. Leaf263]KQO83057.1 hypothetical protein ASF17_08875 [Frigoribacterium sp. Leaf263]